MEIYQKLGEIKTSQEVLLDILKGKKVITNPKDIYLDNADVMQLLKVSLRTLANWRSKGIITYSKLGGKILYTLEDIQACVNNLKFKIFKK